METNGQHMDDARFKLIVDILLGRTSTAIPAKLARAKAEKVARRAVADIMIWSLEQSGSK